MNSWGG